MAISLVLHGKGFTAAEWAAGVAVCAGLVLVGVADLSAAGSASQPVGLVLVSLSVVADAAMPNFQQRLFQRGEARSTVQYVSNLSVTAVMLVALTASGDLAGAARVAATDTTAAALMLTYTCVAYFAVSSHMRIVQRFGGVVGVLVGNGRKVATVALSFAAFQTKPATPGYIAGTLLSLGGLTAAVVLRDRTRGGMKPSRSTAAIPDILEECATAGHPARVG
jgi:adenosine 3'-phospho 5'-phosphosulfate transporter B3